MSQQIAKGTSYTDASPNNVVNATNLNLLADGATLTNGAVINQTDINLSRQTADSDVILLGVPGNADTTIPFKTPLNKLLSESVRNQSICFGAATGGGGAYAVTLTPAPTAYAAGMIVRFRASAISTGAPTLNVNALGAVALVTGANVALGAGDIQLNQVVEAIYDTVNANFQVSFTSTVGPSRFSASALQGIYQYAGSSFASFTYGVTLSPAATAYVAGMVVRFLAAAANVPDGSGHSFVNVNALGAQKIFGAGGTDILAGDIANGSVVTLVYDGTNFQLTTVAQQHFTSGLISLPGANAAIAPINHGLPFAPRKLRAVLVNQTTELAFSVGDEVNLEGVTIGSSPAFNYGANATQIFCGQGGGGTPATYTRTSPTSTTITPGDWKLKFYAEC